MKKLLGGFALAGALFMMVGCKSDKPAENPATTTPAAADAGAPAPAEGTTTPPAQ
jgi:hypothetical protein